MPVLCKCFDDLKWVEKSSVNHALYKQAGIITQKYNTFSVDDVFKGSFSGVPFDIVEVDYKRIEQHRNSKGSNSTAVVTIFDGIIISLDMNKNFSAHTLVKSDSFFKDSNVYGLKHTTLEDVVFEKKYDVFTNDEVEARYLLTTSFMEKLTNMKTIYNTQDICCAFYKKVKAHIVGVIFNSFLNVHFLTPYLILLVRSRLRAKGDLTHFLRLFSRLGSIKKDALKVHLCIFLVLLLASYRACIY
jgi:hypothetical protein